LKNAGGYLSAAVCAGLLSSSSQAAGDGSTLNLVSAPALAKKLGITVSTKLLLTYNIIIVYACHLI